MSIGAATGLADRVINLAKIGFREWPGFPLPFEQGVGKAARGRISPPFMRLLGLRKLTGGPNIIEADAPQSVGPDLLVS